MNLTNCILQEHQTTHIQADKYLAFLQVLNDNDKEWSQVVNDHPWKLQVKEMVSL
jgi:hypothetical protein